MNVPIVAVKDAKVRKGGVPFGEQEADPARARRLRDLNNTVCPGSSDPF